MSELLMVAKRAVILTTLSLLVCALPPGDARAADVPDSELSPSIVDNPLTYDARMVALGGASAGLRAEGDGALAIANPALIDQVKSRAVTATFTPYLMRLTAPFRFANKSVVNIESGTLFGPFSQLGLNMRLTQRLVVGMVAFVTAGAGGSFDKIPLNSLSSQAPAAVVGSAQVGQVAGELLVPLAFTINRYLTVALAYRITHAWQLAKIYTFTHAALNEASLHGTDFAGVAAGVVARPHKSLQVGLSYRSQTRIDMSGQLKTFGQTEQISALTRRHGFNTPHRLRLGLTYQPSALPKLALMLEARLWLYNLLNAGEHNAAGGAMGAEYQINRRFAVRGGYSLSGQPTSEAMATPFAAPPGLGHAVLLGAGARLADWAIDAAAGYIISGATLGRAPVPGLYMVQGALMSISATYAI